MGEVDFSVLLVCIEQKSLLVITVALEKRLWLMRKELGAVEIRIIIQTLFSSLKKKTNRS